MIAFIIVCAVILLIVLVLHYKLFIHITCYNNRPELLVKLGFLEWYYNIREIIGDVTGELSNEDWEEIMRIINKNNKRLQKKKKKKKPAEKKGATDVKAAIKLAWGGLVMFWSKYKRYAKLEKYLVKANVGTDDPAKTAVVYGAVATVASTMHVWALSVKNCSRKLFIETEVKPDFISEKTDLAIDVVFSLRLWQAISCFITYKNTLADIENLPPKNTNNTDGKVTDNDKR